MKQWRWMAFLWLGVFAGMVVQTEAGEPSFEAEPLSPDSPFEYNLTEQVLVATNGAIIRYTDEQGRTIILMAQHLRFSERTGEATAAGAVSLHRGGQLWMGDRLSYNFLTQEATTDKFRTGLNPIYAQGVGLQLNETNQYYEAREATLTTDDVANPGYRIRAKRLKMVSGKSLTAYHAVLYFGNTPIMYFPVYKRDLDRHPNNWVLVPGYRSLYGPFLLSKLNLAVHEKVDLGINTDYRQKRGFGVGPDIAYDLGKGGQGEARLYYLHDQKPGDDPSGNPIDDERYRVRFYHRVDLRTNLTVQGLYAKQSDAYVIRDFFEGEYRKNIQPKTFIELQQSWPNFGLSFLAQPQVNDFYETVERLPEVKLTGLRQKLGLSPFYYDSESSAGYYDHRYANNSSSNYSAFRADTYHQILLPRTFFGWLNVTPRVGGRATYYSETRHADLEEQTRLVFNTGAEVSTKISRTWPGLRNKLFELDGVRHILEPLANYVYVPNPSETPNLLPQFDSELPSYSMIPLDFPDYNAIDSIDSQNVLRFGVRNKILTKRNQAMDNFLNWSLFTDWRIDPRSDQTTFSDVYSDLDFKPRSWLILNSEIRYAPSDNDLRLANHMVTLKPGNRWSVSLGHRYLREDPTAPTDYQDGNNLFLTRFFFRLNENYAFQAAQHYEARDGVMEEQYYTIYRDLRSWTAGLTFRLRNNRQGDDDFTVALTFSLKAFPRYDLGEDSENPYLLLGY